jgi:hypothetical protein
LKRGEEKQAEAERPGWRATRGYHYTAHAQAILEELLYGRQTDVSRVRRIVYDLKMQNGGGLVLTGGR